MIISKPRPNTIFSLSLFVIIAYSLLAFTINHALESNAFKWYHIVGIGILGPLGVGINLKTVLGYKTLYVGNNKVVVKFPFRFKSATYFMNDLVYWDEISIKTASQPFLQMELLFENGKKVKLGKQENSNYEKVRQYLKKKHQKKKKKP